MKIFFLPKKTTKIHPTHCLPSPTKQSSTPTLDGQLMIKDYYVMMTVFGCQILLNNHNHPITGHCGLSEGIIRGQVSDHSSRIIASLVRIALDPKHPNTDHMEIRLNTSALAGDPDLYPQVFQIQNAIPGSV